ncbi:MAG: LysR family transcriptional regulator [Lachnospiraceae bacterium]|nr:LysR family transcriptional regulator [Lachnospiraceae bacterium]
MNFQQISYFISIVEDGSISAASRRLYISQQALSEQLKRLEKELHVTLFKRDKNLVLTDAGRRFYDGCINMLTQYNSLVEEIRTIEDDRYQKITIGFPGFGYPAFLNEVARRYLEKRPTYHLDFVQREHHDIPVRLEDVDLYVSPLPLTESLNNHVILDNDIFVVSFRRSLAEKVYGSSWPETEKKLLETKSLAPLEDMPFSLLFNSRKQLLHSTQIIFREHNFNPYRRSFSETTESSDMLCISGIAAVIAPLSHAAIAFYGNPMIDADDLLSYPIEVTSFRPVLAVSHLNTHRLHEAEEAFISECRDYFSSLKMPELPVRGL